MFGQSKGWPRSVDRGTCRRSIEPRNIWKSGCRRCLIGGKATLVGATSRAPTGPARSKTSDMHGTSTRENRETLPMPDTKLWAGRSRKVMSHNLDMNVGRESDRGVLPAKCPNKGGSSSPAEGMEGRPLTKENTGQMAASQIQCCESCEVRVLAPPIACSRADSISDACRGNDARSART